MQSNGQHDLQFLNKKYFQLVKCHYCREFLINLTWYKTYFVVTSASRKQCPLTDLFYCASEVFLWCDEASVTRKKESYCVWSGHPCLVVATNSKALLVMDDEKITTFCRDVYSTTSQRQSQFSLPRIGYAIHISRSPQRRMSRFLPMVLKLIGHQRFLLFSTQKHFRLKLVHSAVHI